MLNYIWGIMILVGIIYGSFSGNMAEVTNAAINSSKEAVSLCITMVGVMSLWVGLMEIARDSGLIEKFTRKLNPFVSFMFPKIPHNHKSREYISTNIIANMLGLGWAATPAGLMAMKELGNLNEELHGKKNAHIASKEMCTFLIINISSLQLIPVNMIAYRSQYGSVNPASIIAPGIIATLISTLAGIIFAKCMDRKSRDNKMY